MSYQPRYSNLVALLNDCCERYAEAPLFGTRKPGGWHWIRYREFRDLVARARGGIAALGVQPGDRVAVISNNRLEWVVCAYASYTLGAAYVPMYESQLDRDWRFILRDSGSKLCFVCNDAVRARVRELQADVPELQHVIEFDGAGYRKLLEDGAAQPAPEKTPQDDQLATIIYTSGTTGQPKGVRLSHYNLAANASAFAEVAPVKLGDRSVAFLPWAHVFGGSVELNTLISVGASLAICDKTDRLLEYLPEVRPTMLFAVPRIWNRVYDGVRKQVASRPKPIQRIFELGLAAKRKQKQGQPLGLRERAALPLAEKLIFSKIAARFGGQLRFAFSGAAALSADVAEFIDNLGIQVYEGYGMTESSGGTTANLPGACRFGSVGKPVPGVHVKLDETAPGTRPGEGEILIYGTGVMQGYHNNPEATRECFTQDGGLRSGDLGRIDDEGFVFVTGRVKELYKLANGKYVAPAPLEEKLQLSPFITQCVVYGGDQPYNVALIVPDMAALSSFAQNHALPTDPAVLLAHPRTRELIRGEIETYSRDFKGYEAVRDFLLSSEPLTTENDMLTPTLKLKRPNVMAKYEAQLKRLYRDATA